MEIHLNIQSTLDDFSNSNNELLFWRVWKNKLIRKNIINQIKIFKEHRVGRFYSIDEIYKEKFLEYIQVFEYYGQERLLSYLIPESAETVVFGYGYNKVLSVNTLPSKVKKVNFGQSWNQVIQANQIPSSVETLILGCYFDSPIAQGVLPNSITYLEFGKFFNQLLEPGVIPSSVLNLNLANYLSYSGYSKPLSIGSIPNSVTTLGLSICKQPLPVGVIPNSVKKLKLSGNITQTIQAGAIPNSVEELHLDYSNSLNDDPVWVWGSIPDSCTILHLGSSFKFPSVDYFIPFSVTELHFSCLKSISFGSIPLSVVNLNLGAKNISLHEPKPVALCRIKNLAALESNLPVPPKPSSNFSRIVSYFKSYNSITDNSLDNNIKPIIESIIPNSVTTLSFNLNQPISKGVLPTSIKSLSFINFNHIIKINEIPSSVTSLNLGDTFDKPLECGVIPSSVTSLCFGDAFDKPLECGVIPSSVTYLKLGYKFNHKLIQGSIPSSVKHLEFGKYFNRPLTLDAVGHIPFSTLSTLEFNTHYNLSNLDILKSELLKYTITNIVIIVYKNKYNINQINK